MCVIKVKPCKIDLLLNWSTTKLFSASLHKFSQFHFIRFWYSNTFDKLKKKHWYGSKFYSNTGIAFPELKAEKKQLVTEN